MKATTISKSKRMPSGVGTYRGQTTPHTKTMSAATAENTSPDSGRFFEIKTVTGYSSRSMQRRNLALSLGMTRFQGRSPGIEMPFNEMSSDPLRNNGYACSRLSSR